jgi:hypothetical protein
VHGLPLKPSGPLEPNVTLPVGVLAVAASVSVTVAVHVDGVLTASVPGEQLALVEVERRSTVTAWLPLLPAWVESPP